MDCFVGASTGALKSISFKESAFNNISQISSLKPQEDAIACMSWTDEDQTELLVAQVNQQLKLFDTTSNAYTELFAVGNGSGAVKGVKKMKSGVYISAVESGEISVSSSRGKIVKELNAGSNLIVMVPNCEREEQYATGGKENPLKVWDVEKGERIFLAKNVRPDEFQLRVPVWVNGIRFIPKSQSIVTVTGEHQIRLYDPRTQRRPIKEMEWAEEPLTAMSLCRNDMQLVVGNSRGDMGLFDLRNKIHMVCKYKGFAGCISGIDAHQSADYIASCSLDRFVRLHDLSSKKLIQKVYCKARLNCILLRENLSLITINDELKPETKVDDDWEQIKQSDVDDGSSEDEALWNDVKHSKEKTLKRKCEKNNSEELVKKPKVSKEGKRKHNFENPDILTKKKIVRPKRKSESIDEIAVKRMSKESNKI
ncbi:unnamed protein product [Thelazia callipaeda]|uniref:WD_REPEATS_REGION domain-containing protein n=1 Tax=Thelazia callipaeda TaxID=103827 RepID=A0A0N5D9R3_THECL|nr:unnamed protein product [Thelazia callipaeda]